MPGMTCQVNDVNDDNDDDDDDDQNAWDDDEVTNTIWHPGTSGEGAHTTMHSKHKLIIHRIRVRQHRVSFVKVTSEAQILGQEIQISNEL